MRAHLQLRIRTTTRMPDTQHFYVSIAGTVVEEIMDPSQVQTPHPRCSSIRNSDAHPGLEGQKRKSLRDIFIEGFWGKGGDSCPTM